MDYLQLSRTKCLDFQSSNKKNHRPNTPVEFLNWPLPPASNPFGDLFSIPTADSVPASVSVSSNNHFETLLTLVLNTSYGGGGSWFGLCWPVSGDVITNLTPGMSTYSSWVVRVQLSSELEDFMGRSFKMPKGGIRLIVSFIAVDTCVKHHFLAKLCCFQKYVIMKMYVLKDAQSIYGPCFWLLQR